MVAVMIDSGIRGGLDVIRALALGAKFAFTGRCFAYGLGAIIALFVFSITAVAPPLVVDREVDFVTAMAASMRAVAANPRPMLAWAIVIGAGLAIAFVTLFVALVAIFPLLGHATWHLYRRVIV